MRHGLLGAEIDSAGNQRVGNHHRCEKHAIKRTRAPYQSLSPHLSMGLYGAPRPRWLFTGQ